MAMPTPQEIKIHKLEWYNKIIFYILKSIVSFMQTLIASISNFCIYKAHKQKDRYNLNGINETHWFLLDNDL